MKRLLALMLAALALSGCGSTQPAPIPETVAAPTETEAVQTVPETAAETRPETLDATVIKEGNQDVIPVKLWQRPEYSLYFTVSGDWYLEVMEEEGYPVDFWRSGLNPLVSFAVYYLGSDGEREAEGFLAWKTEGIKLYSHQAGTWGGSSPQTMEAMEARLVEGRQGNYLMVSKFPLEAAEGFGVDLSYMMDSFLENP